MGKYLLRNCTLANVTDSLTSFSSLERHCPQNLHLLFAHFLPQKKNRMEMLYVSLHLPLSKIGKIACKTVFNFPLFSHTPVTVALSGYHQLTYTELFKFHY